MRKIEKIIVHCSASEFGNAKLIEDLHTGKSYPELHLAWPQKSAAVYRKKPFKKIGYHYVILNGYQTPGRYIDYMDGTVEKGREDKEIGAHCKGHNKNSLGVCLVGNMTFTSKQLYIALPKLLTELCKAYGLSWKDIYGHYELNERKTCPNVEMQQVRWLVRTKLNADLT